MSTLTPDRFAEFYEAANGFPPFPWQRRLAARVCAAGGAWPRAIALPTAAGNTGCIDVAVFALACQAGATDTRTAPRRIFFVVDRRVVVDQAYLHARKLADRLRQPKTAIEREVAAALRRLADDERPLDVYALRGGMYREDTWVRSPLQPTVITSTVDQVGSRLLFRGYGVSDSMQPIHAGLVGNDGLILLDEAHCSTAFAQTAEAMSKYRAWAAPDAPPLPPFAFVQMTATPAGDIPEAEIERDQDDDRNHPFLGKRLRASKPARLVTTGAVKGKNWRGPLLGKLVEEARGLMGQKAGEPDEVRAVGVIVNRVATAREVAAALEAEDAEVILLTGRMRPLDRDAVLERLRPLFTASDLPLDRPTFVVATQTLEVGADLDFHALVTECASLDALRQRFGRLNRHAQTRTFAPGVIVVRADQTDDTSDDPVYGESLAKTWQWLKAKATGDVFDFGVAAVRAATAGEDLGPLSAPAPDAPVLLPAYLDCWVQTRPRPTPDPDPALFLHGPQRTGVPDVQVVFRGDLGDDSAKWAEVVSLCPPSSSEALPVRIDVFRRWLAREDAADDSADVEGGPPDGESEDAGEPGDEPGGRVALCWSGRDDGETRLVNQPGDVGPSRTYVVPTTADDATALGDFPGEVPADHAGAAFLRSRDRVVLRLTGVELDPEAEDFDDRLTEAIAARATPDAAAHVALAVEHLSDPRRRTVVPYPHPLVGFVVAGKRRLRQFDPTFADDESAESPCGREVTLEQHTGDVVHHARRFAGGCGLSPEVVDRFTRAAYRHDLGKADPRFQGMLRGNSPRTATGFRDLLAKSGAAGASWQDRERARAVHRYPKGARHEMLSVAFLPADADDLELYLIAGHHGYARPFAPPIEGDAANEIRTLLRKPVTLFGESFPWPETLGDPAVLNATVPDRFWRVVRRYGWWGSAYLDALFRLADHAASRAEQEEDWTPRAAEQGPSVPADAPATVKPTTHTLTLTGLDGSNPLAFLAALGVLRVTHRLHPAVRMNWVRNGRWVPALELPSDVDRNRLLDELHGAVHRAGYSVAIEKADTLYAQYRERLKAVEQALKRIREQKLRGAERDAAERNEIDPLRREAEIARGNWLQTLEANVPAVFLSLGRSLSVTPDEFRRFTTQIVRRMHRPPRDRQDGDFAAAFGCEACVAGNGRIVPTEFQLITGSGHQFFLETLGTLMEVVSREQLERALFDHPWPCRDPRLSFRWNPADDRRYAYAWGDPSGEEVRTEHGANLLAALGLPLLPLIPTARGPSTTGFDSRTVPITLTWPVWEHPLTPDAARSVLVLADLFAPQPDRGMLRQLGIAEVFRARKIEVGRPPLSKLNLTAAVTV